MKNRIIQSLVLGMLIIVGTVQPGHADFFTIEASPSIAGSNGFDSYGLGIAATLYIIPTDVISIGLRPDFAWHETDAGHDLFFTGNVQVDISVSDTVVPSAWIGAGFNKFYNSGFDLGTFLAGGGTITQQSLLYLAKHDPGIDTTGGIFDIGGQVKFFVADHFYIAPEFTYIRHLGTYERNSYRGGLALGLSF